MRVGFVAVVQLTPAKEKESPEVEPLGSETIYSTYQAKPDVVVRKGCVPLRVPSFPFPLFDPVEATEFMAIMLQRNRGRSG